MLEKESLSLKVNNSKDLEKSIYLLNNKNNLNKIKKLKIIRDLILKKNLNELGKII